MIGNHSIGDASIGDSGNYRLVVLVAKTLRRGINSYVSQTLTLIRQVRNDVTPITLTLSRSIRQYVTTVTLTLIRRINLWLKTVKPNPDMIQSTGVTTNWTRSTKSAQTSWSKTDKPKS